MRPERRRAPSSRASACAATAAPTSVPALDLGKGRGHSEGDEERGARETKRDLYLHWQRHRHGIHRIRPGSVGSSRPPIGSDSPPPRTTRRRRQGGMGRPPPTRSGQGGRRGPDPHEGERGDQGAPPVDVAPPREEGSQVPHVEADARPMSPAPPVDVASGEEWRGGDDGVERRLPRSRAEWGVGRSPRLGLSRAERRGGRADRWRKRETEEWGRNRALLGILGLGLF